MARVVVATLDEEADDVVGVDAATAGVDIELVVVDSVLVEEEASDSAGEVSGVDEGGDA